MSDYSLYDSGSEGSLVSSPKSLTDIQAESSKKVRGLHRFASYARRTGNLVSRGLNIIGLAPGAAEEITNAAAYLSESLADRHITGLPETTVHLVQLATTIVQEVEAKSRKMALNGQYLNYILTNGIDNIYRQILDLVEAFKKKSRTIAGTEEVNIKVNALIVQLIGYTTSLLLEIQGGSLSAINNNLNTFLSNVSLKTIQLSQN